MESGSDKSSIVLSETQIANNSKSFVFYVCGVLLVTVLMVQISYKPSFQTSTNNLIYCQNNNPLESSQIELLKRKLDEKVLEPTTENLNSNSSKTEFIPAIYVITPTYARTTQKSDLTSVLQAAAASRLNIHFILVEDTSKPAPSNILKHFAEDYLDGFEFFFDFSMT